MSDWKIGLTPPSGARGYWIVDALNAQHAWKRLSKPARAAVADAYPDGVVEAHPATKRALWRHGFIAGGNWQEACSLTPAAREVCRWMVRDG